MAKFLHGNELNSEVGKIISQAHTWLVLMSPFIKLHHRYIDDLKRHKANDKLNITIVFGKNESDKSRSFKVEDLNFFKDFPNIEIHYERRLHAKYYGNEIKGILTSMNLYDHSVDNNIEAGILLRSSFVNSIIGNDLDKQAWEYFKIVINNSELLFEKRPEYSEGILGTGLIKKYLISKVKVDKLDDYFRSNSKTSTILQSDLLGYCIACNKPISFSEKKGPFCPSCFSVGIAKNDTFSYCHFCGKQNASSWNYPVCKLCYSKGVLRESYKK